MNKKETIKEELSKSDFISRLYIIQNIMTLVADFPEEQADFCVLQGAADGAARLIDGLIDDIGE